jgi:ribonuclease J
VPATLTGFGGVGEIGGNAFLLSDGRSSLLLDFGKRFGNDRRVEEHAARPGWNDYLDEYLRPRTFRYVPDLLALGLVPDLPGAYRHDLGGQPAPAGAGGGDGPGPLAGVVVSHAHMDHVGMLGLLRPQVPVLAGPLTRAILESIQETGVALPENEFVRTRPKGLGRRKDGGLSGHARMPDGPVRAFDGRERGDVAGFEVEHFGVDHSIHGARATLVSTPEATVAYTGDFRLHGRGRHLTERFLERAGGVQVLVAEGTNVHGDGHGHGHAKSTDQESEVEAQVEAFLAEEEARPGRTGFVGISYPPRDLDRFQSIWAVARRHGRRFVISPRQAHLLDSLRAAGAEGLPDPRTDPTVAIHFEAAGKGLILAGPRVGVAQPDLTLLEAEPTPEEREALLRADYREWAHPYLDAPNRVCALDIAREPAAYLFSISFWSITELLDIFPDPARANGLYIHSQTQPFNDEMVQDARKLDRWLRRYSLDRRDTHVSGHLGQKDLEWAIDLLRPRLLVPVHTQQAALTAERYQARTGQRAAVPEYGRAIPLG